MSRIIAETAGAYVNVVLGFGPGRDYVAVGNKLTYVNEATLVEAAERKALSSNPADLPAEVRERMVAGKVPK